MMRFLPMSLFVLALAGCSEPAQTDTSNGAAGEAAAAAPDVDAAVMAFYEPYMRAYATGDPADWDRPIFSPAVRALVEQWKTGFNDQEVAELQDFAWLCECQDYDHTTFKPTIKSEVQPDGKMATADVDLDIGWGESREAQLQLVLEGGQWVIDDIRSEGFPEGLKAALAMAIQNNAGAKS